jgi:hypothetical protein
MHHISMNISTKLGNIILIKSYSFKHNGSCRVRSCGKYIYIYNIYVFIYVFMYVYLFTAKVVTSNSTFDTHTLVNTIPMPFSNSRWANSWWWWLIYPAPWRNRTLTYYMSTTRKDTPVTLLKPSTWDFQSRNVISKDYILEFWNKLW